MKKAGLKQAEDAKAIAKVSELSNELEHVRSLLPLCWRSN